MDNRQTLSIIAGGGSARRASRIVTSVSDEQNDNEDLPNDFTIENLSRRRSSRVKKEIFLFR